MQIQSGDSWVTPPDTARGHCALGVAGGQACPRNMGFSWDGPGLQEHYNIRKITQWILSDARIPSSLYWGVCI